MEEFTEVEREFSDAALLTRTGEWLGSAKGTVCQKTVFSHEEKNGVMKVDHAITGFIVMSSDDFVTPGVGDSFFLTIKGEPAIRIGVTGFNPKGFTFQSLPYEAKDYQKFKSVTTQVDNVPAIGLPPQCPPLEFRIKGDHYTLSSADFRLVSIQCQPGSTTVRHFNGVDREIPLEIPYPDADEFTVTFRRRLPQSPPRPLL